MQHTPGEWITVPLQYGIAIKERSIHERGFSDHIAEVDGLGATQQADAKLIAAAPDLLAACIQFINCSHQEHFETRLNEPELQALMMMKQAIQKATI